MALSGNTPLTEIRYKYDGTPRRVFAKLEFYNPTGSIKDRIAEHIVTKAKASGELVDGMPIVEATSGNTGIAFSAFGRLCNHPVHIFMPNWMSAERISLMQSFGATLHLVSLEEGGFLGSIELADRLAAEIGGFRPNQFSNEDNSEAHYLTTGPEIWEQMQRLGRGVDAFVAGVGTGGTVMGTGRYLRERNCDVRVHPLEPSNSPTLTTGHRVGKHRIQGISDEFIPPICRLSELCEPVMVDDGDAIIMAQRLSAALGLGVGISSGANFLGAVMLQNRYGADASVVTVFSDDNKKYLSTDYVKAESVKEGFISSGVELVDYRLYR